MSKQRMIRDSFWTDAYVEKLSPDEKLVFIYLLTNPLANVAGVYEIRNKRIGFETGYDVEVVENILTRFERDEKILRHKDWIVLVNHIKNQALNPSIIQGCERIFNELSDEMKERVTGWVQAGLLNLTLLNLTFICEDKSSLNNKEKDMFNKYSEDYEENSIDFDSGDIIPDEKVKADAERKELRNKIKHNLSLLEGYRGLPFGKGKELNFHTKIYEELLGRGWSHQEIAKTFLDLLQSDYWKEKKQTGEYPGMNTVQFTLRNKQPK